MKKVICLVVLLFTINLTAQEALYISTQTGEYTIIEGSGSAETDDNESGNCDCSSSGPILYEITPTSINTNELVTVNGFVHPDPSAAPEAGTSNEASISCDCTWNWLTWNYVTEAKDKAMSDDTSAIREYNVISIKLTVDCGPPNIPLCRWQLSAETYPVDGGTVTWTIPGSGVHTGKSVLISYDRDMVGKTVSAVLDVDGVTYSASTIFTSIGNVTAAAKIEYIAVNPTVPDPTTTVEKYYWSLSSTSSPDGGTSVWSLPDGSTRTGSDVMIEYREDWVGQPAVLTYTVCGEIVNDTGILPPD